MCTLTTLVPKRTLNITHLGRHMCTILIQMSGTHTHYDNTSHPPHYLFSIDINTSCHVPLCITTEMREQINAFFTMMFFLIKSNCRFLNIVLVEHFSSSLGQTFYGLFPLQLQASDVDAGIRHLDSNADRNLDLHVCIRHVGMCIEWVEDISANLLAQTRAWLHYGAWYIYRASTSQAESLVCP